MIKGSGGMSKDGTGVPSLSLGLFALACFAEGIVRYPVTTVLLGCGVGFGSEEVVLAEQSVINKIIECMMVIVFSSCVFAALLLLSYSSYSHPFFGGLRSHGEPLFACLGPVARHLFPFLLPIVCTYPLFLFFIFYPRYTHNIAGATTV